MFASVPPFIDLRLVPAALCLLLDAAACSPSLIVTAGNTPRFVTGVSSIPPARAHYIAAAPWGQPQSHPISGYDYLATIDVAPPYASTSQEIVQGLSVSGSRLSICGGTPTPISEVHYEYFVGTPAYDTRAYFGPAEASVLEQVDSAAAFISLVNPPPIGTGNVAAVLDQYMKALPPAERAQILTELKNAPLKWTQVYEYDGCNTPPKTFCSKRHCLVVKDGLGKTIINAQGN